MLKFNTLLRIEGLDPKDVKLVRHQDTRYNGRPTPYQLWRADDGCDAFAEDTWTRFRIGDTAFRSAGKSDRCIVTTTDQLTGERGKEPLKTLATFRRGPADPTAVYFGVNLIHETKQGTIRLGEMLELL